MIELLPYRPPPTVLNFFKPISNGVAKKVCEKKAQPQALQQSLKRPRETDHEAVDLLSIDEPLEHKSKEALDAGWGATAAPINGVGREQELSQGLPVVYRQQDELQSANPITIDVSEDAALDAAVGSKMPSEPAVQDGEMQRPTSSFVPSNTAPVRRYRGVPYAPDAGSIGFLTNMGFGHDQAVRALKVTQGNLERAANWLLSGM